MITRMLAVALTTCLAVAPLGAEDWPQFRGPNRDGISSEAGWLSNWPEGGPKVLWKQPVGRGYSSVAVAKGRIFTIGMLPAAQGNNNAVEETVTCLDEATGKVLWRFSYSGFQDPRYPGSRSTPTVDGKVVYVYGQHGGLYCLECETGKVIWQKLMVQDLGAQNVTYGYAASPLVVGDMVLVPARILKDMMPKDSKVKPESNALLLAFNKSTGAEVWRMYHESFHLGGGYYACPTACVINGKPCLAYHTGNACFGLDPATGKVLWKHSFSDDDLLTSKGRHGITGQEPAVLGNRVLCCVHPDNSNGLGVCLEVNGDKVSEVWRDKLLDNYSCSYIIWKGHCFGIQHNDNASRIGPLYCFDIATGRKKWEQRDAGGSFTLVDGKFLTFTGEALVLAKASTDQYSEIARSGKIFTPEETTHRYSDRIAPVLANGRIYCRSQNGVVACLDVRGK